MFILSINGIQNIENVYFKSENAIWDIENVYFKTLMASGTLKMFILKHKWHPEHRK